MRHKKKQVQAKRQPAKTSDVDNIATDDRDIILGAPVSAPLSSQVSDFRAPEPDYEQNPDPMPQRMVNRSAKYIKAHSTSFKSPPITPKPPPRRSKSNVQLMKLNANKPTQTKASEFIQEEDEAEEEPMNNNDDHHHSNDSDDDDGLIIKGMNTTTTTGGRDSISKASTKSSSISLIETPQHPPAAQQIIIRHKSPPQSHQHQHQPLPIAHGIPPPPNIPPPPDVPPPPSSNNNNNGQHARYRQHMNHDDDASSDSSVYNLQHRYLSNEINEIEDQRESKLLAARIVLNVNDDNDNNNNSSMDDEKGVTPGYVTDNGYQHSDSHSEGTDDIQQQQQQQQHFNLMPGHKTTYKPGDSAMDLNNVPPAPQPPPVFLSHGAQYID